MFKNLVKKLQDPTRGNLYKNLMNIGINCELLERGAPEEKLFNPWYRRSLGVLRINSDSTIKYVNIIKMDGSKNNPPKWWFYFAVPGKQIGLRVGSVEIKSRKHRAFPVFGKIKSISWETTGNATKLAQEFSNDPEIQALPAKLGNIKITSLSGDFSGFCIEIYRGSNRWRIAPIDLHQWKALNRIAEGCTGLLA